MVESLFSLDQEKDKETTDDVDAVVDCIPDLRSEAVFDLVVLETFFVFFVFQVVFSVLGAQKPLFR